MPKRAKHSPEMPSVGWCSMGKMGVSELIGKEMAMR